MSTISGIIDEVTAAALADAEGCDPKAHSTLLRCIQRLTLAAEKPLETAKRLLYQVSKRYKAANGVDLHYSHPSTLPSV